MPRVQAPELYSLARGLRLLAGEFADRLEHLEAGFVVIGLPSTQEALLDQEAETFQCIEPQPAWIADGFDPVQ